MHSLAYDDGQGNGNGNFTDTFLGDDDDADQDSFLKEQNLEESLDESDEDNQGLPFAPYVSPPRNNPSRSEIFQIDIESANLNKFASKILDDNMQTIMSCSSQIEQIVMIVDLLKPNGKNNPFATWEQIGDLFKLSRGAVASHYARGLEEGEVGNIQLLSDDEINILIEEIFESMSNGSPLTYDDITFFIKERFDKSINKSALYKLIHRIPQLKSVEGQPMDSLSISWSPEEIYA